MTISSVQLQDLYNSNSTQFAQIAEDNGVSQKKCDNFDNIMTAMSNKGISDSIFSDLLKQSQASGSQNSAQNGSKLDYAA